MAPSHGAAGRRGDPLGDEHSLSLFAGRARFLPALRVPLAHRLALPRLWGDTLSLFALAWRSGAGPGLQPALPDRQSFSDLWRIAAWIRDGDRQESARQNSHADLDDASRPRDSARLLDRPQYRRIPVQRFGAACALKCRPPALSASEGIAESFGILPIFLLSPRRRFVKLRIFLSTEGAQTCQPRATPSSLYTSKRQNRIGGCVCQKSSKNLMFFIADLESVILLTNYILHHN